MTEQARDTQQQSQQKTSLMFVNHASLLIKQGDRYLLTDPWHLRVGFGSWLPTFQQYVHPTYLAALGNNRAKYANRNVAFFSQTNSASGHPLSYTCFDDRQKLTILRSKVKGMVVQGMKNADALGLDSFYSYAGFASIFVREFPSYLDLALIPTAKFIRDELLDDAKSRELLDRVNVRDFYPGDVLDLSDGKIATAFIAHADYSDKQLKDATVRYYDAYGIINQCDTYKPPAPKATFDPERLLYFLDNLNKFVGRKIQG